MRISALTYCRNYLSSDKEEADLHLEELKKRIVFAGALGVEKAVTSTGIDKQVRENIYDSADSIRNTPPHSLDRFTETFLPIVELAEKHGVKLAFENLRGSPVEICFVNKFQYRRSAKWRKRINITSILEGR